MLYPYRNHWYTRSWGLLAVPSVLRGYPGTHCQPRKDPNSKLLLNTRCCTVVEKKKEPLRDRQQALCHLKRDFHLKINSLWFIHPVNDSIRKEGLSLVGALYVCCMHSAAYKLRKMNLQLLLDFFTVVSYDLYHLLKYRKRNHYFNQKRPGKTIRTK